MAVNQRSATASLSANFHAVSRIACYQVVSESSTATIDLSSGLCNHGLRLDSSVPWSVHRGKVCFVTFPSPATAQLAQPTISSPTPAASLHRFSVLPRNFDFKVPLITSTWPNHLRTKIAHLESAGYRTIRATPKHIGSGASESKSDCPGRNMSHRSSHRSWSISESAQLKAYRRPRSY